MEKEVIFKGAATALITPFRDGEIDYWALEGLIEMQIREGISALVICGTTAEAATLTDTERYSLFAFAKEKARGRVKLIFGTGTNDTKTALRHTKAANDVGCDGILVVTPYYNKGTEGGIVNHYLQIAEASMAPVLLYNVPSRTGVNLTFHSLDSLADHKNIVGIKEASDSIDRAVSLSGYGPALPLYAGNDSQIYSTLALGGLGAISVLSNAYPAYVSRICHHYFDSKHKKSLALQQRALPMIRAIFAETNPTPIKYLLFALGLCRPEVRLPLTEATDETKVMLDREILFFNKAEVL